MRKLWYRFLITWYRLTGSSSIQAEWKARKALDAPSQAAGDVKNVIRRGVDQRFFCVCGQMLVEGDKTCIQCGRRQYVPHGVLKVLRTLRGLVPGENLGVSVCIFLIVAGFLMQIKYGLLSGDPYDAYRTHFVLGASFPHLTLGSQPWRGFTYIFLHGGWMHIAFNTIALIQIGPLIEKTFGSARFLFAWLLAGFMGAAVPILVNGGSLVVGASGSVFGLIGMALIYGHLVGTSQGIIIRNVMFKWVIFATVFGLLVPNVAHGAHFAGLASGIACGYFLQPELRIPRRRRLTPWLGTMAFIALAYALVSVSTWVVGGGTWSDTHPSPRSERELTADVETWVRANPAEGYLEFNGEFVLSFAYRRSLDPELALEQQSRIQSYLSQAQEAFGQKCMMHAMGLDRAASLAFRDRLNQSLYRASTSNIAPSSEVDF